MKPTVKRKVPRWRSRSFGALVLSLACVLIAPASALAIGNPLVIGSAGSGEGQFQAPAGIAVSPSGATAGNIWVADSENDRVQRFSESGSFLGAFGSSGTGNGQFDTPADAATDGSTVWVTDEMNNRVQSFAASTGAYLGQFGTKGTGNGQLVLPTGIARAPTGNLWVVDTGNDRIQEFTSGGSFVRAVGGQGSGNGQFNGPQGIAVDAEGNVYVVDTNNDRVEKFSSTGTYLSQFGGTGTGNGQFDEPVAIDVAADGTIWVTDRTGRVQQFSAAGKYLSQLEAGLSIPSGIATAAVDTIYVSDTGNDQVERWSPEAAPAVSAGATTKRNGASLTASINPHGWATSYHFEYGTSAAYGTDVPASDVEVGSGVRNVSVSQPVTGLVAGLTYHYRVVAENAYGVSYSADQTFTVPDIRWTKSGLPLGSTSNAGLSGSLSFSGGTSCSSVSGTLAMDPGYSGRISALSATPAGCTVTGTLASLGCTSVTSFEAQNLPWTADAPVEGPITAEDATLVYGYTGGKFCPSKVELSGDLTLTPDKSSSIGSLTISGTLSSSLGSNVTVGGTLNLSPAATYGFAPAGSRWSQEGSQLTSAANVALGGTFAFSGGTSCTATGMGMTLNPGSTAQATEFGATLASCTITGTVKTLGCTAVTSVAGSGMPWSAYTLANGTIYVPNATIVYQYTGGKFCPGEVKLTGAFTMTPDKSSSIGSLTISGTMNSNLGSQVTLSGSLSVSPSGKYGIE